MARAFGELLASEGIALVFGGGSVGLMGVVADAVLANGGNIYVKFNTADKGCKWNFKIEWADAGYPGVLWKDIDLCSIDAITLKYDRATDTTSAELK